MSEKFVYDKMTPELKKYLKASRKKLEKLWSKVKDQVHAYSKAQVTWRCRDGTEEGEPAWYLSPMGHFNLKVTRHGTKPGCWSYSKGVVSRIDGKEPIATVCRNYSAFPYAFIEGHAKTGSSYLVCGEDYQGRTVIDLETGQRVDWLPKAVEHGCGFCSAAIHPSPDGTMLAVEGCIWAAPYEVRIFDFEDPMKPPWITLGYSDEPDFGGWVDGNGCRVGQRVDHVNLPGHRLHGLDECKLSAEDLDEIEAERLKRGIEDDEEWEERTESKLWTRPSNLDVLREQLDFIVKDRKAEDVPVYEDFLVDLVGLLDRLTPGELKELRADEEHWELLAWAMGEG